MLELKNVTKVFYPNTINERKALNHVNLLVNDGDFITILGSNGAGKSTLFNVISGHYLCEEGQILLDGEDITKVPEFTRAKEMGRLFQDPLKGTAPHMTIEENLALAYLRASGKTRSLSRINKEDRAFFKEHLKQLEMGLEDRMDIQVGMLSGGQRQALTLLMATIVPPKLLLLDEHTASLDPKTAELIIDLTKKIIDQNHTTCLMITHNLKQALHLGNRTLMMNDGQIILEVNEEEKKNLSVDDLLSMYQGKVGDTLDNDRILLSTTE